MKPFLVVIVVVCISSFAFAQNDKACLLEGKFEMMRQKFDIKDCALNEGLDAKSFKEMCKSFSQGAAAMGAPPAKITYMSKCPEKAQAQCKGFAGQKINFYYYKRDVQSLKDTKTSCGSMGGKWSKL